MGVRTIGYRFTGDYSDLTAAFAKIEAKVKEAVNATRAVSDAAADASTGASQAIKTAGAAAVRSADSVVKAEQKVIDAVQAHQKAVQEASAAAVRAAAAEEKAAKAVADAQALKGKQGVGDAREVARAETTAAKVAAIEAKKADAAVAAASREVRAAEQAAAREVAAKQRALAQIQSAERAAYQEQERRVRSLASIEAAAYREQAARIKKADDDARSATDRRRAASSEIGTGLLGFGVATAVGIGVAVKAFADFDQAMSRAAAGTDATAQNLAKLRQAAITALGKAGVSVADILGGGLKGSLDLAAAGQLDVANAAEIGATAMTQFNLQGKDLPHVADLLAAGAGKAQGEVTDLANALKYVGPVANGFNISIEETVGTIAELASQGIIGEQAGTSLRGMLLSLAKPSKEAAALMKDLGIQLYDSTGKFIGFNGVAGQLRGALGKLTNAQRDSALGTLFGNEQVTAAQIIYRGGAEAVDDWTRKVNDSGFAMRQANALTNNLRGDLEKLGGSFQTVFIQSGSGSNEFLRSLTQNLTDVVNAFGDLPDGAQQSILALGALLAVSSLLGGGLLVLIPKIAATRLALIELTGSAAAARTAMLGVGAGLAVLGTAAAATELATLAGQASVADVKTKDLADSFVGLADKGKLSGAGLDLFDLHLGPFTNHVDSSKEALEKFGISAYNALDEGWDARLGRFQSLGLETGKFKDRITQVDGALAYLVQHGNADAATKTFEEFTKAAVDQGVPLPKIAGQFVKYQATLDATKTTSAGATDATKKLAGGFDDAGTEAQAAATAIKEAVDAAGDVAGKAFTSAVDVLASFDPSKTVTASKSAKEALERVGDAKQRVSDIEQRIAERKKGATSADERELRKARESVKDAQDDARNAAKAVGDSTLAATYKSTIAEATQFTRDISTALSRGLDPQYVEKLLQEGPKQAGPVIRDIVSDHSGKLIKLVNDSEKKLKELNTVVVEEARLTQLAISSGTSALSDDLATAVRISNERLAEGAKATTESVAKSLKLPKGTVQKIADEFGIQLLSDSQKAIDSQKPLKAEAEGVISITTEGTVAAVNHAEEVAVAMRDIPDAKPKVALEGKRQTTEDIRDLKDFLHGIPRFKFVTVKINTTGPAGLLNPNYGKKGQGLGVVIDPGQKPFADGGLVPRHLGGPRQDNVSILASGGEWVHNARAVQHYGDDFMRAVNEMRLPRFAEGGPVSSTSISSVSSIVSPKATITQPPPPAVVRIPVHESHTRTVQVGDVIIPGANPRDFEDWAHEQRRRAERSFS